MKNEIQDKYVARKVFGIDVDRTITMPIDSDTRTLLLFFVAGSGPLTETGASNF